MSATELLHEIGLLPQAERLWLIENLLHIGTERAQQADESAWSKFSARELLEQYGPEDSVYDKD